MYSKYCGSLQADRYSHPLSSPSPCIKFHNILVFHTKLIRIKIICQTNFNSVEITCHVNNSLGETICGKKQVGITSLLCVHFVQRTLNKQRVRSAVRMLTFKVSWVESHPDVCIERFFLLHSDRSGNTVTEQGRCYSLHSAKTSTLRNTQLLPVWRISFLV
jgi:hypothetical protein